MNIFKKIFNFFIINLYQVLGILFSSLLMFMQFCYSNDWQNSYPSYIKRIIIIIFIIYFIIQIISVKDNIDKSKLKKEVENWRNEASLLLDSHIYGLSRKLKFGEDENSYINRLSLYKKDEKGFYCISRYADSEEYKNKSGKLYQNRGILSIIWDKGNRDNKGFFDNDIPDCSTKNGKKKYKRYHKNNYSLTDQEVDELHMQSFLYYGYKIDLGENLTCVILFESTKRDKFSSEELDNIFTENIQPLNHSLRFILPNIIKPTYDDNKSI